MKPLTPTQHTAKAFIVRHIQRYGFAPTVREFAEKTGRSPTAAHYLIDQLVAKGHLVRGTGLARSLRVPS